MPWHSGCHGVALGGRNRWACHGVAQAAMALRLPWGGTGWQEPLGLPDRLFRVYDSGPAIQKGGK
jgi:hypothetical protein